MKLRCVRRFRIGRWFGRLCPRLLNVVRLTRRLFGKIRKFRAMLGTRRRLMIPVLAIVVRCTRKFRLRTVRKLIRFPLTFRVTMWLVVVLYFTLLVRFTFRSLRRLLKVLNMKFRLRIRVVKGLIMVRVGRLFMFRLLRSRLNRRYVDVIRCYGGPTIRCECMLKW